MTSPQGIARWGFDTHDWSDLASMTLYLKKHGKGNLFIPGQKSRNVMNIISASMDQLEPPWVSHLESAKP